MAEALACAFADSMTHYGDPDAEAAPVAAEPVAAEPVAAPASDGEDGPETYSWDEGIAP